MAYIPPRQRRVGLPGRQPMPNRYFNGRNNRLKRIEASRGEAIANRTITMINSGGGSLRPTYWNRWRQGISGGGVGLGLVINTALAPAFIGGEAVRKSVEWGTSSGYQEDYVGGFVYGWEHGKARAGGMIAGDIIGVGIGATIGALVGGPFAAFTAMVGSVAGSLVGESVGGILYQKRAYERGRIAARATAGALAKRKVQFGRGFADSQQAYTMRQMAVQEMAGSLMNARQYLGNEAAFYHQ